MKIPLPIFKHRYSYEHMEDRWHMLWLFGEPIYLKVTSNVVKMWKLYLVYWSL